VRIIALVQRSRAKVREVRGKPTDVARELLREGKLDEVAALVDALVARNSQLELLVAALKARRNKAEGVSKEQLSLALEELAAVVAAGGDVDSALARRAPRWRPQRPRTAGAPRCRSPLRSPHCDAHRRRICGALRIRFQCLPLSAPVRAVAPSARR
jgi:hypothetical protein